MERKLSKQNQKNCVFWVGGCEDFFLLKWHFLENKLTLFVFGRYKKGAFSLQLSVLGEWSFFGAHSKSPKTTKIGVSAGTGENPKRHFWLQKCHFGKGPGKGVLLSVIPKSCFLLKALFYSVFSETQLCRNTRVQLENKKNLPRIGGCLPACKKVFFCLCFLLFFWWFCFFFVCFILCLEEKTKKAIFLQFQSILLFSPQRLVFKILLFFLFCFLFWFSFCLPFQNSIFFSAFCPSTPFWKALIFLVSLSFFFLPFPFLMFACFFQTNFPNIPFLKPKLLSFLVVYLFIQLCVVVFHVSCFCLSVLMLALFFVIVLFMFCFLLCLHRL